MREEMEEKMMNLLKKLNELVLRNEGIRQLISDQCRSRLWCGEGPASESDIELAERRLSVSLPESYQVFLSIANGWRPFGQTVIDMLAVENIGRLGELDFESLSSIIRYRESIVSDEEYRRYDNEELSAAIRPKYYAQSILVGKGVDGELVLLNPYSVSTDGEWETLFFAHWIPGNKRYRSFIEFVEDNVHIEETL